MEENYIIYSLLVPFLNKCSNKVFLEAGANDGIRNSNSLPLENNGWTGILVEPNNRQYQSCIRNRPNCISYNKALVSFEYEGETIKGSFGDNAKDFGLVGGVRFDYWEKHNELQDHQEHLVDVGVMTLSEVIEQSKLGCPSFISLDVEGYELEILKGLNVNIHRPDLILIEILEWDIKEIFDEHISYMEEIGYKMEKDFILKNNYLFSKITN